MITIDIILERILALGTLQGVDVEVIGYSMLGRPIYSVHIGSYTGKQMIMEGGIHAREYISTLFLIEEVKYLATFNFSEGGIYIVPCVNPDGIDLVLSGVSNIPCEALKNYLISVNGGQDFRLWKANANAVDINVNFDALFGTGTQNVFCPSSENFVGYYPNSERETRVMIDFTTKINPSITISWHTKGEVIYYGFATLTEEELARDLEIANMLRAVNGYPVVRTYGSVGGYQDYVSLNFKVPAYTIELGSASIPHPIGEEYLLEIFELNKDVPIVALQAVGGVVSAEVIKIKNLFNC